MDQTSMDLMKMVVDKYGLSDKTVVDIGSYDINGTYKSLFTGKYIGVDILAGSNVDVLMDSPEWEKIKDVDAVISGQTLENVADIPGLMAKISKVLKPGGILSVIVPSRGIRHDYPIWVGNFEPEQVTKIFTDAGFEVLSIDQDYTLPWYLVTCVGKKPEIRTEIKPTKLSVKRSDDINDGQYGYKNSQP